MKLFLFSAVAVFSVFAFGEVDPLPTSSIWEAIVLQLQGLQGASLLAIVAAIVEVGVVVFRTSIGQQLAGIYTLAVIYGLSAVSFLVHGLAVGTPILSILGNAVFIGALLNSGNEIIKHLFKSDV